MPSKETLSKLTSTIDFERYKSPELFENIAELVSVPGMFAKALKFGLLALLVFWVATAYFFYSQVHWGLLIPIYLYSTFAAVVIGLLLGVVRIVNDGFENMIKVADLSMTITRNVYDDSLAVADGTTKPPSIKEISRGVHDHVVYPALKTAFCGQFGVFGRLIVWFYDTSLGRMLAKILESAPEDTEFEELPDDTPELSPEEAKERAGVILAYAQTIQQWLVATHDFLVSAGGTIKKGLLTPLYVVFFTIFFIAVIPLFATWYLTHGEDPETPNEIRSEQVESDDTNS